MYEYTKTRLKRRDIVYPELSYQIIGVLFGVWNELGYGYQEKYYQKAAAAALGKEGLEFREQVPYKVTYEGKKLGQYFLDFVVEDKVVLELKKGDFFPKANIEQVHGYLQTTDLPLGIIANFTSKGLKYKRIINISDSYIRVNS